MSLADRATSPWPEGTQFIYGEGRVAIGGAAGFTEILVRREGRGVAVIARTEADEARAVIHPRQARHLAQLLTDAAGGGDA